MNFDWSQGELAEGLRCYRAGRFFEAHEHWESVWLTLPEPHKAFLQAVIQVAAAFHHFQRKNLLGTSSLLGNAMRRLQQYPDVFAGVAVSELRSEIETWLKSLNGGSEVALQVPRIRIVGVGSGDEGQNH
jgi:uncharacterized protein